MYFRRKRPRSLPGTNERQTPSVVDQLSFKYMMCKMDSSTDSDSEISPRWSDTSTLGCVKSAPASLTSRRALSLTHKPAGRSGGGSSLFLDPYDGSSEESEESGIDSSRITKLQGKSSGGVSRLFGRSRRITIPTSSSVALKDRNFARGCVSEQMSTTDVQMKCSSDSELWVCESDLRSFKKQDGHNLTQERASDLTEHTPTMELECNSSDIYKEILSVPQKDRFQPAGVSSSPKRSSSSSDFSSIYKRKLGLPGADVLEQRKKQCVFSMEDN